jgi:hypothetical protein
MEDEKLEIYCLVLMSLVALAAAEGCKTVMDDDGDDGKQGYQWWKGAVDCWYFTYNWEGDFAMKITGKPWMVLTIDKIQGTITDCEFGFSEVRQETLAEGAIPEPTVDASMIDYHEKLGLQNPVVICVSWGGKSIINGVQNFYFKYPENGIGSGKNVENWMFNYTNTSMTGAVNNLDTNNYLGRQSTTNAFALQSL